jgi:hypothetical protein
LVPLQLMFPIEAGIINAEMSIVNTMDFIFPPYSRGL